MSNALHWQEPDDIGGSTDWPRAARAIKSDAGLRPPLAVSMATAFGREETQESHQILRTSR